MLRLADQSPATVTKALSDLASLNELASLARANTVLQRGLLRIRHTDGWHDMDAKTYAKAKVERAWAGAGFTHFEDGHWLMTYVARHL